MAVRAAAPLKTAFRKFTKISNGYYIKVFAVQIVIPYPVFAKDAFIHPPHLGDG